MQKKYKLIRDEQIRHIDESLIEICDSRDEILKFSCKEIINLVMELQESDGRDVEIYADILQIIELIAKNSFIQGDIIQYYKDLRTIELGNYSGYLKREEY